MNYLFLAFSFLTVFPVRLRRDPQPGDLGRAAVWFPLIGVMLGGLTALALSLLRLVFPPLVAAGLAVGLWIGLSGGLHLDGLADCCDGMLNASKPERRLEIMKDPRLGTFGGIGLILMILLKVAAILALANGAAWQAIPLAAGLGRWLLLPAGKQPQARPGGMGADFAAGLTRNGMAAAGAFTLALALLAGWQGIVAALAAHLAAFGIFALARKRLGGVTGDVLGLTVEVSELVVLLIYSLH